MRTFDRDKIRVPQHLTFSWSSPLSSREHSQMKKLTKILQEQSYHRLRFVWELFISQLPTQMVVFLPWESFLHFFCSPPHPLKTIHSLPFNPPLPMDSEYLHNLLSTGSFCTWLLPFKLYPLCWGKRNCDSNHFSRGKELLRILLWDPEVLQGTLKQELFQTPPLSKWLAFYRKIHWSFDLPCQKTTHTHTQAGPGSQDVGKVYSL